MREELNKPTLCHEPGTLPEPIAAIRNELFSGLLF
jgi:hypothetical protein